MKNYFLTLKLFLFEIKTLKIELYIQILISSLISLFKIFIIFLFAKIIDALISKNIDDLILFLFAFLLINLILINLKFYKEKHKIKYFYNKIDNIFSKKLNNKDNKEKILESINHFITILTEKIIPVFSFLFFAVLAIFYYSPLIALWCSIKIIILLFWIKNFTMHKNNIHKLHQISYYFTHGHRRDLLIILGRSVALIVSVLLYLKGKISLGGVYAIYSFTSDIFSNTKMLTESLYKNSHNLKILKEYLLNK